MPTIEQNRSKWDGGFGWDQRGDDWSAAWGGVDLQWNFTIRPRIQSFLPAPTILEIAPGFGRWTQFLKDEGERLVVVDLSQRCIDACRDRFRSETNIEYHVNDGLSLSMIPDDSVDFVFSFDSLVHVEADVMAVYIEQLSHKLTGNGVGVIHHSNLGEHSRYLSRIKRDDWVRKAVFKVAKLAPKYRSWRAASMSAALMVEFAEGNGLECVSQEKLNWDCRATIDCISAFTRPGSMWSTPNVIVENTRFMREIEYIRKLSPLYATQRFASVGSR